jgi:O-antigen/teichoic acid export membrane protein
MQVSGNSVLEAVKAKLRSWRAGFTGPAARDGLISVLDQGILMGTNFATSVLIVRYCAKETFGIYVLALSVLNLTTLLQSGIVTGPIVVIAAQRTGADLKRYLTGSMLIQMTLGLVTSISVAGCGYVALAPSHAGESLGNAMLALGFGLWAIQGKIFFRFAFYARLRTGRALFIDTLGAVVQLGAVVWLLIAGRLDATSACYALGFGGLVALIVGLALAWGEFSADISGVGAALKENWHLGRWLLGTSLAAWLIMPALPWFLKAFGGEQAVAEWGAAINIANISGPFVVGFSTMATSRFANGYAAGGSAELRRLVRKGTHVIAMGMIGFMVAIAILGEWAAGILYAHKFPGIGHLATMISVAQLVSVLGNASIAGLASMRRTDLIFVGTASQALVTVALGWMLCRMWGPPGAAGAMLVAGAVASALYVWLLGKLAAREQ